MGRPRGNQRDAFTPSGAGRALDDEYSSQPVPAFVPKHRTPPYMDARIRRKKPGAQGAD